MTAERWQQIEELFHSVAARPAAERAAMLERACGGDESLRAEVERLLLSHDEAGSFIKTPAFQVAAGMIADEGTPALPGQTIGQTIGPYKIRSLIGAGGMGEVYLASDTRMNRDVALKVLLGHLTKDQQRVARFQQEARAVLTLNHPNIVTIYEIGEVDGVQFIAGELVEGETLRSWLARGEGQLSETLEIAMQVAGALAAAHQKGVVHRDIKPENIMLRPDGYVKVLDFGIAKLTEREAPTTSTEAPTIFQIKTHPGMVMGTAHYMSPEQARGLQVDGRTDIWSLGCVLYEMVAGRVPFEGATPNDVISAILEKQAAALARYEPEAPAQLQWIVTKALRKDADERYQTIKELLSDLKELKQDLDVQARLEQSGPAVPRAENWTNSSGGRVIGSVTATAEAKPSKEAATHTTSSAEYVVGEIKRHKTGVALALATLLIVFIGLAFGIHKVLNKEQPAPPFQHIKISKLTNSGHVSQATISPDGKYVVYEVHEEDGRAALQLRQLATNTTLQILAPANVYFNGTTFSRDGSLIYFVMGDDTADDSTLYQASVIGGTPKKVLAPVNSSVSFAPDGKRFAYVDIDVKQAVGNLMIANTDGTNAHPLFSSKDFFLMPESPAWSPDGKVIMCAAGRKSGGFYNQELYTIDSENGAIKQLTANNWRRIYRSVWQEDGRGLIFLAAEQGREYDLSQIWHVAYPGGIVSRITNDTHGHGSNGLGLTADARTIVTVEVETQVNIWTLPASGDASQARQVLARAGDGGIAWTPDGKIIYSSLASGMRDIWLANADGSSQIQLTSDAARDYKPVVSRDGHYVVFRSVHADINPHLWRMDIDGGNLKQLTTTDDGSPSITPDQRWVVYDSWITGWGQLWKVPIDGGTPIQLTNYTSESAQVSPDGKLILCIYFDEQVTPKRWRNAIISIDGGRPLKAFDRPQYAHQNPHWTADGRAFLYIGAPVYPANIWTQPLDGSPPRQLTNFNAEAIFGFAMSPDGKQLAIARGSEPSDVVLISDELKQ